MKAIISKVPYYMPLIGIYALTLVAFVSFSDRSFQKAVVISAGLAHVVWGIIYHFIRKDLTTVIVLEYIAIAILGVASILSIL